MSNSNQYNQGYNFGAASTQEQARGARDAEMERQRRDREFRDQMNNPQRKQEEKSVAHDYSKQQPLSNRTATGTKPKTAAKSNSDGSLLQGLIGLAGFIGGLALGGYLFKDSGFAIFMTAIISAFIAAESYKLLIGLAFVVFVIAAMVNSEKQNLSKLPPQKTTVKAFETTPRNSTSSIAMTGLTTPSATFNYPDPKTCVVRSTKGFIKALEPATKVDTRKANNNQRITYHQNLNAVLKNQDISHCPAAFQAAHHNLLEKLENSLDAGIRRSQIGGEVSWLNGVPDNEYEIIRKHMSAAMNRFFKTAVEYAPELS